MNKKIVISMLMVALLLTMACNLYGAWAANEMEEAAWDGVDQPTLAPVDNEAAAEATAEPEYQDVIISSGSNAESGAAGTHEYSVAASNFGCTCQATDNMTVDIKFTDNGVEITNGGGGATQIYEKMSENKYKKTEMGYYILVEGSGDEATETKVEEENITIITFTGNGYVMESFKGEEVTPCCYYTFTIEK